MFKIALVVLVFGVVCLSYCLADPEPEALADPEPLALADPNADPLADPEPGYSSSSHGK
jgi:hypothetical protein